MSFLLSPLFLSEEIALYAMERAVRLAIDQSFLENLSHPNDPQFHVVMLVPGIESRGCYPDMQIQPHLLAEYSHGDQRSWRHDFAKIARNKTLQLWHCRNGGGTDSTAHLLFPGDTPFWGGIMRDGIAVGCSGDKPCYDRMISDITISIVIGIAHDEKTKWVKSNPDAEFLPKFLPT